MSIYLYIKTHQTTGLKYFGKTVQDDPYKYKGSGTYWKSHLKKHGNLVDTEVLGYFTKDEVEPIALKFSKDNNIVESKAWANLMEENGLDGAQSGENNPNYGKTHSDETRAKISAAHKHRTYKPHSDESRAKISVAQKGKTFSAEHKAKLSAAHKGKPLSAETRAKISAAHKGKTRSAETSKKRLGII